jgi:alpha-glucosidase
MTTQWWKSAIIYQVYPRSFSDSNNDGVGDLCGITDKLDYIAKLGVDAVWISPFFRSPMKDFGYDVSDFYDIDPLFGTMKDFEDLVAKANSLNLRIIIDMVLNHTSDQHAWFLESASSRDNPKADWYVWADPKPDGSPPNNWLSVFGGSSWQWNPRRRQYYLHNFLKQQPDLNYHNPMVRRAMLEMMRFWLDKGVRGFRMDAANFYFHDLELRNNPPHDNRLNPQDHVPDANTYSMQLHIYDQSRPENMAFLSEIRSLLNEYDGAIGMAELGAYDADILIGKYTEGNQYLHMGYGFNFLNERFGVPYIKKVIASIESHLRDGWACWAFSNHDAVRPVTRWNDNPQKDKDFAMMLYGILLSLRGSVCVYQGEELGLPQADIAFEDIQDPYGIEFWPEFKGRDGCRTPMPWQSDSTYAGFSEHKPWLPIPQEHKSKAVDVQQKSDSSEYNFFINLVNFRKKHLPLLYGDIQIIDHDNKDVLILDRSYNGEKIRVVFNLSDAEINYSIAGQGVKVIENQPYAAKIVLQGESINLQPLSAVFISH